MELYLIRLEEIWEIKKIVVNQLKAIVGYTIEFNLWKREAALKIWLDNPSIIRAIANTDQGASGQLIPTWNVEQSFLEQQNYSSESFPHQG